MQEAIATFTSRAAEKLRYDHSVAGTVHVFIETNGHRSDLSQHADSATIRLPVSTAYTPALIKAAGWCLDRIFKTGFRYKRAGVLFLDIGTREQVQQNLFMADPHWHQREQVMRALDRVNKRFGRNTLSPASNGFRKRHRMNQQSLSPCYTTRWSDLPVVKAQ